MKDLIVAVDKEIVKFSKEPLIPERTLSSISERTLRDDIKFMKDPLIGFNAPIVNTRRLGYYYDVEGFSIFNISLEKNDIEILKNVLSTLKYITGKEKFKGIELVIKKLEQTYNIENDDNEPPILMFEHSLNEDGQKWVNEVYQLIKAKKVAQIKYQPFDKEEYDTVINPYLLKEYNNRWFLIGHETNISKISILALDRIKTINVSLIPYNPGLGFNSREYLNHMIGVSRTKNSIKEKIRFKVYSKQRHYILKKPLHQTQIIEENNAEWTIFTIDVFPNYELESALLAYGESIEVLTPKSIRDKLKQRVKKMSDIYDTL